MDVEPVFAVFKKMFMKLKEIQSLVTGKITLEIEEEIEIYRSIAEVPDLYFHYRVLSLKASESSLFISLEKKDPPKTLEELGFSFESGV